jgi:hypothetical protein
MVKTWRHGFSQGVCVLSAAAIALTWACGSQPAAQHTPTPAPTPTAQPSAASVSCATSGPASPDWSATSRTPDSPPEITSAAVSGDAFTLTFVRGTPAFEVHTQSDAHFTRDPSGQPVALDGKAGLRVVLRGFRGDTQNYAGLRSITANGATLLQVAEIGDFEGVFTWGLGLTQPGCAGVTAAGSTLTFLVVPHQPAAATAAALDALARQAFPGDHPAGCGPVATCPVTDRLRARLQELSRPPANGPGPLVEFCRCQNGASSMAVTSEVSGAGGVAHVTLVYGPGSSSKIDLIIVQGSDSQLLVDDTQCTGKGPSTSIYAAEIVGCG